MATSTFTKFNCFVEDLAEKVHNLGSDQLVVALCASANAPTTSNTVLANLTQIAYTNLSSRNITTTSSSQTSGAYKLVLADLTLSASGGSVAPFRYVVIYNDTSTSDSLIGFADYGSDQTLGTGESMLIDFDGSAGAIAIS